MHPPPPPAHPPPRRRSWYVLLRERLQTCSILQIEDLVVPLVGHIKHLARTLDTLVARLARVETRVSRLVGFSGLGPQVPL